MREGENHDVDIKPKSYKLELLGKSVVLHNTYNSTSITSEPSSGSSRYA